MILLALDTSSAASAVALVELRAGGPPRELAQAEVVDGRRHGEVLAPLVAQVLAQAGLRPGGVHAVAAGVGPGPFTGLRVGLVTAVSFAHALGVPCYGVPSLQALAAPLSGAVTAVGDARRREVYTASFSGGRPDGPHRVEPAGQLAERLHGLAAYRPEGGGAVVGAGAQLYREVLAGLPVREGPGFPSPVALAALAAERALAGGPGEAPAPLYLRRPDAAEPRPRVPAGSR